MVSGKRAAQIVRPAQSGTSPIASGTLAKLAPAHRKSLSLELASDASAAVAVVVAVAPRRVIG